MLRFGHSPLNIIKNKYRVCIYGEMETELHLFFYCNTYCTARTALHNKVYDILNETGFAERFERFVAWVIPICCAYIYMVCLVPDAQTAV